MTKIQVGDELEDLVRPARTGRVVAIRGRKVAIAWSTGRTTTVLARLLTPSSRHYQIVSPLPSSRAKHAAPVPTSIRACRDDHGAWVCAGCLSKATSGLVRPWRALLWTVGPWQGHAAIVCSDGCQARLRAASPPAAKRGSIAAPEGA